MIRGSKSLINCPNIDNIFELAELHLDKCSILKALPNLEKFTKLEVLSIKDCKSIGAFIGVGSPNQLATTQCSKLFFA